MATMQFSYTVCIFGPHTQFFFYCSFNSYLFSILIGHYSLLRTGNRAARPLGMNNLQSFFRCSTFFCNDLKTSHLSSILNCMWCFIILYPVAIRLTWSYCSLLSNAIFCCFINVLLQSSTTISPLSISHILCVSLSLSLSSPHSHSLSLPPFLSLCLSLSVSLFLSLSQNEMFQHQLNSTLGSDFLARSSRNGAGQSQDSQNPLHGTIIISIACYNFRKLSSKLCSVLIKFYRRSSFYSSLIFFMFHFLLTFVVLLVS